MIYPTCGLRGPKADHYYDEIKRGKAVCRYCRDEADFRIVETVHIVSEIELKAANIDLRKEIERKLLAEMLEYFQQTSFGELRMFDDTISIYERETVLGTAIVAEAYSI